MRRSCRLAFLSAIILVGVLVSACGASYQRGSSGIIGPIPTLTSGSLTATFTPAPTPTLTPRSTPTPTQAPIRAPTATPSPTVVSVTQEVFTCATATPENSTYHQYFYLIHLCLHTNPAAPNLRVTDLISTC